MFLRKRGKKLKNRIPKKKAVRQAAPRKVKMNYYAERDAVKSARITLIVISVVLILALGLFALIHFTPKPGSGEMLTKAEIEANVTATKLLGEEGSNPKDYQFVASYLSDFGIGNFNGDKFTGVETCLEEYYYKDLPPQDSIAYLVAEMFVEKYYDEIDLESYDEVTDALLRCYMRSIGDDYAYYRNPEEYLQYIDELMGETGDEVIVGIGVNVIIDYNANTILVGNTVKGAGAEAAGILPGDYIIEADGLKVDVDGPEAVLNAIKGEAGTTANVKVKRGNEIIEFNIVRKEIESETSSIYYGFINEETGEIQTEGKLGYILIVDFLGDTSSSGANNTLVMFRRAVDTLIENGAEGIVFDVRNNPGGLLDLVVQMVDYLLPDGKVIVTQTEGYGQDTVYKGRDGHSVSVPMVVLCNEYSASAAEIFASAIRDYASPVMGSLIDAALVGNTTFGKGIVQSTWLMQDQSSLTFTTSYYNPPCGTNFHGKGVEPDVFELQVTEQLRAAATELLRLIEDADYEGGSNAA